MSLTYGDPLDVLLDLQRALEARLESGWLRDLTTSMGPFPPINVFQQGEDFVAIIELPGVNNEDVQVQAKENAIRIAGKEINRRGREYSPSRTHRWRVRSYSNSSGSDRSGPYKSGISRWHSRSVHPRGGKRKTTQHQDHLRQNYPGRRTAMAKKQELQVQKKQELQMQQKREIERRLSHA
jgi:hypothetical protein